MNKLDKKIQQLKFLKLSIHLFQSNDEKRAMISDLPRNKL